MGRTLSMEASRAAGHSCCADAFFVPSERKILAAVTGRDRRDLGDDSSDLDHGPSPSEAEESTFRDQAIAEGLSAAFGPLGDQAIKDLLDARLCQGGWREFSRLGMRYSRPPQTREKRIQRMRLALVAQELYEPGLVEGNPWFMGPLYFGEGSGAAQAVGPTARHVGGRASLAAT